MIAAAKERLTGALCIRLYQRQREKLEQAAAMLSRVEDEPITASKLARRAIVAEVERVFSAHDTRGKAHARSRRKAAR